MGKTREIIANDSHLLKEISKNLINKLREKSVSDEVIFHVHVAFEEALRNAMVHGNREHPEKKVTIEIDIKDKEIEISIEDEGEGFDIKKIPDPTQGENLVKESGRGVYLIKHLMDKVTYEEGGRKVVMMKTFS